METAFPDILENRALADRLSREIRSGKLSHAYILSGPDGSGKHMLAVRIAAALSCRNRLSDGAPLPCMTCPSCRKILEGNSPDLIYIRREGGRATLGVEQIRFLREDVLIAPNDTDVKIYVIEDAETMTPQAQNALLLTLEEPPSYVLFLLLAANTENLLETVRSRAPILRMEPIPPEGIRAYLDKSGKAAGIPADELTDIVSGAGGSIGRALELLHPDKRKPLLKERELVRRLLRIRSASEYLELLPEIGTKRDEVSNLLSLLAAAIRDLLAVRKSDAAPPLCFFYSADEAENTAGRSAQELAELYHAVTDAAERIGRNANVRLTLTKLGMDAGLL